MSPLSQVHHGVAKALLQWMDAHQALVPGKQDVHGDHDDMVSVAASDLQNGATGQPALENIAVGKVLSASPPLERPAKIRKVESSMQLALPASAGIWNHLRTHPTPRTTNSRRGF
eukprot:1051333-Amphidinium_carterae.1